MRFYDVAGFVKIYRIFNPYGSDDPPPLTKKPRKLSSSSEEEAFMAPCKPN
jgi:hypothetical protein